MSDVHVDLNIHLPATPPFRGEMHQTRLATNPIGGTGAVATDLESLIIQTGNFIRSSAALTDLDHLRRHVSVYIWPDTWQADGEKEKALLKDFREKELRDQAEATAIRCRTEIESSNALIETCAKELESCSGEITLDADHLDNPEVSVHLTPAVIQTVAGALAEYLRRMKQPVESSTSPTF